MGPIRRSLTMPLQLFLSPPFSGGRYPMLSPSFKDDLRLGQCITSVVLKDNVWIDVSHLVTMVTNIADHLCSF